MAPNRQLARRNPQAMPVGLRLLFLVIGLPMLLLCFKSGGQLFSMEATFKDVLNFLVLLMATAMALVLSLPAKFLTIGYLAFSLLSSSILLGGYFWKFGGIWKFGIIALIIGVPWLFVYALRKRRERLKSSDGLDHGDFSDSNFDFGDCAGGNDGGGSCGGGD